MERDERIRNCGDGRWTLFWLPNQLFSQRLCGDGVLPLTVNDSYGDGLQYGGVVGNYTIEDGDGNVLAQMVSGGNFGSQATTTSAWTQAEQTFQVARTPACNYDSEANTDDGSCVQPALLPRQRQRRLWRSANGRDVLVGVSAGTVFTGGDCNDANSTVYPGAPELALESTTTATEQLTPVKKRPPHVQKTSTPTEPCRWPMCSPSCLSLAARQDTMDVNGDTNVNVSES